MSRGVRSRVICPTCRTWHAPHCRATDRRWPISTLVDLVGRVRIGQVLGTNTLGRAPDTLSDRQADRWAIALGLHPGQVWPDWFTAALTPLDQVRLEGGWRPAWLHNEQPTSTSTARSAA